jgi:hypothetical protein
VFPEGLPDIEDIKLKRKKRYDEKVLFWELQNPPGSPLSEFLEKPVIVDYSKPSKAKERFEGCQFDLDVDEAVLDQVVEEAIKFQQKAGKHDYRAEKDKKMKSKECFI